MNLSMFSSSLAFLSTTQHNSINVLEGGYIPANTFPFHIDLAEGKSYIIVI